MTTEGLPSEPIQSMGSQKLPRYLWPPAYWDVGASYPRGNVGSLALVTVSDDALPRIAEVADADFPGLYFPYLRGQENAAAVDAFLRSGEAIAELVDSCRPYQQVRQSMTATLDRLCWPVGLAQVGTRLFMHRLGSACPACGGRGYQIEDKWRETAFVQPRWRYWPPLPKVGA